MYEISQYLSGSNRAVVLSGFEGEATKVHATGFLKNVYLKMTKEQTVISQTELIVNLKLLSTTKLSLN